MMTFWNANSRRGHKTDGVNGDEFSYILRSPNWCAYSVFEIIKDEINHGFKVKLWSPVQIRGSHQCVFDCE